MFWEVFGEPWTSGNHAKVYNYMHFHALDPFGTFFWILVPIGAPIGAPFGNFWQLFQGLILEAVFGLQKEANDTRNGLAGGRGGAC